MVGELRKLDDNDDDDDTAKSNTPHFQLHCRVWRCVSGLDLAVYNTAVRLRRDWIAREAEAVRASNQQLDELLCAIVSEANNDQDDAFGL